MLDKMKAVGIIAAAALTLSACEFSATGSVDCTTNDQGQIVCTGSSTATPATPVTPAPEPEPEEPGTGTEQPPVDDAVVTPQPQAAVSGAAKARVFWTPVDGVTGWRIARDGTDSTGYGPWGVDLPASTTDVTFDLLRPGTEYTFSLTALTQSGRMDTKTVSLTMPTADTGGGDPGTGTPPPAGSGDTAAESLGWGTPVPAGSDEFNGSSLDRSKWGVYNGEGHDGNGRRLAERIAVGDGKMTMTGLANGDSAGMASTFDQRYGRWEARVRSSSASPGAGRQYHPLLIIWPESNRWPDHGEYDFFENGAPGLNRVEAFLHYPGHTPKRQEFARKDGVDTTQWQNIAFEWTPDHLKGFVNGEEWFSFSEYDITEMPSGHLTIQLDNFFGGGMTPATYEVDWVRAYTLS